MTSCNQGFAQSALQPGVLPRIPVPDSLTERIIHDAGSDELVIYTAPDLEPIQVKVIARFESGMGDRVYAAQLRNIQSHPRYIFEEGEHSALIFSPSRRDESALYSLAVGREALTWHRHPSCAHRILTVTTGSGGAMARFSLATEAEIAADPLAMVRKMVVVELPPDSQVTIRFNGLTWHQFGPRDPQHPAFTGNSVHKNERHELAEVHAERWQGTGERKDSEPGSIPLLTKCVGPDLLALLATDEVERRALRFSLGQGVA